MSLDTYTSRVIGRIITQLNNGSRHNQAHSQGQPNGEAYTQLICNPKPLVPSFFNDHGSALSQDDSVKAVQALKDAGYLDEKGMLKDDPRMSDWRTVLAKALPHIVPAKDTLVADASPVSELLNLAWALHEITDEYIDEVRTHRHHHHHCPSHHVISSYSK
jgi:hypothetical protein